MTFAIIIILTIFFITFTPALAFALKPGVSGTIKDEMQPAIDAVVAVWRMHSLKIPTITSIEDGKHGPNSLHPYGLAIDFRLNDINLSLHSQLRSQVSAILGSKYDVVHENHGSANDHLHVEASPIFLAMIGDPRESA
jgi:hypothetical protein